MDFVITGDGSKTIFHPTVGEHYHSKHGAVQESRHVFLQSGLAYYLEKRTVPIDATVTILEVGFGTGLNFLLTADYCTANHITLHYTGIEAYPLDHAIIEKTGYQSAVEPAIWKSFSTHYQQALLGKQSLSARVNLAIAHQPVLGFHTTQLYDLLYFDAFAAIHQPEMWSYETLSHICKFLKPGGVFVTYAITGNLKRIMKSLGFAVEKAPGAPGKREMLRAVKL
ncbi:tRNA (5-methylaminomethyl-2-thiouridine)(34)-methyltransferase MnmD [Olivibacter sp. SDN3]|uniref:tRNA (5-methylaminomethyl-2-thiouridine)(34)-methyltransferase MnmD n=1 Tax=Olivibacter sp. SDN3 TaxID=2764720 RepID=UPI0016516EFD|nr:tRNA (5-methylaminomethyl-2-thiouridine)(34)-methyltransferase MnmD [Olivibacter sp. SDN3]QNL49863.1 tRNA (5-methylaminomethyl-2-thiouridine)(34)-methyltransferase MnmD [Olivibacter sp. SDN3]